MVHLHGAGVGSADRPPATAVSGITSLRIRLGTHVLQTDFTVLVVVHTSDNFLRKGGRGTPLSAMANENAAPPALVKAHVPRRHSRVDTCSRRGRAVAPAAPPEGARADRRAHPREAASFLSEGNWLELAGPPAPRCLVRAPESAGMLGRSVLGRAERP